MATKKLSLMVGIPASGKSSFASECVESLRRNGYSAVRISRDEVRFSMLKDNQEYFDNEKVVFKEFVRQINEALAQGIQYIYVDATHISEASRKKVLNRLMPDPETILEFIEIECPVEVAIKRNEARSGREKVPVEAIRRMEKNRTHPSHDNHSDDRYGFKWISYTAMTYEGEWDE